MANIFEGNAIEQLELPTIGPEIDSLPATSTCKSITLENDEYITKFVAYYESNYIAGVDIITSKDNMQKFGSSGTAKKRWMFSEEN